MAESLLSVAAEGIITKVVSLATEEISLVWGFKDELQSLQDSLKMIRGVIRDAERRQGSDEAVELWLKKLKGIAYEADDVLDEFAYEILRRKVEIRNQMKRKTLNLLDCWSLEELPKDFQKLASLRHFYMDDSEGNRKLMPSEIGKLTGLQTLPFFVVGQNQGHRIEELGCIGKLIGTLKIYGLEKVRNKDEAKRANLSKKSNVQNLELNWSAGREEGIDINDENVLEGLKPHSRLKGLKILNFGGGNFASWMMSERLLLQSLVKIELRECRRCQQIPTLGHLPCLKVVEVSGLHNVRCIGDEFYGVEDGDSCSSQPARGAKVFPALREFTLEDMPNLEEWSEASSSLDLFPCLEKLEIQGCPRLISIPGQYPFLRELFVGEINSLAMEKTSSKLTSLTSLSLSNVIGPRVHVIIEELLENNIKSLKELNIQKCEELRYLPSNLLKLASLKRLIIEECPNLTHIILAQEEEDVKEIETQTSSSSSLSFLHVMKCEKLRCLTKGLLRTLPLVSLRTLNLRKCPNFTANPHDDDDVDAIRGLTSLRRLVIRGCEGLTTAWEEGLFCHLTALRSLEVGTFSEELEYFPWPSYSSTSKNAAADADVEEEQYPFVSLKFLELRGWPKLKSLPDQIQHLTALTDLHIWGFDGLETLPDWLGNLSSLRNLVLWECTNLMNLPSVKAMESLTNIQRLEIWRCPLLKERCSEGRGPEWHKISHIPSILHE